MRRLGALAVALVLTGLAVTAPTTIARFTSQGTSGASFTTGAILPPTSLLGTGGTTATLGWTASTSTSATGYAVLRSTTSGSGYAQVGTVTPISATTTTDSPSAGTWFYVLRSYLQGWTSASSNEASVLVSAGSTGYKGCVSNAPETISAGDNNGYEGTPANACALDGALATDANSGTSVTASCTNSGKDKHRFWGYAFGLPGAVTSIDGIAVQLRTAINVTGGTNLVCVQLSWDGGAAWTAAQSILPTTTLTTFTLGSAADKWGRTLWAPAELGAGVFRVRIIDASSQTTKTFSLDYVGVQVSYTP